MVKVIIAVLIVTIIALVALAVVENIDNNIIDGPTTSEASSEETLQLTISGQVNRTGTYLLPLDSTLAKLIEAAGGVTSNADEKAYNLDCVLKDKDTFYIAPLYDNSNTCELTPIVKACINTAEKEELKEKVSAFSTMVCQAIVDYRIANGPFARIEDLKNVTGIGPATFEKCKDYVTLR